MHTSEDESEYRLYVKNENIKFVSEDDMYKNMNEYSIVIGMESMLLIELAAIGITTLSYRPNCNRGFIGCEMNWVVDLTSKGLIKVLSKKVIPNHSNICKPNFSGSLKRINKWIRQIYENSSIYTS